MDKLITSETAQRLVKEHVKSLGTECVQLIEARGKVLAQDVFTDRAYPPFNRATMDGICIRFSDLTVLQESGLKIHSSIFAGEEKTQIPESKAAKIMTGACLPDGADTVIRVEDLVFENGVVQISRNTAVIKGQNIHLQGSDHPENQLAIAKGTLIQPGTIAALATIGVSEPLVFKKPKVAIVSTGNELVPVNSKPKAHQIRTSNSPFLLALCDQLELQRESFYLTDHIESTEKMLVQLLDEFDVLLFTGGVSKGEKDFVADALQACGVKKIFHGVHQKPGKPMWFGKTENSLVFAFPGNPVSVAATASVYFSSMFSHQAQVYAELTGELKFSKSLTLFHPVSLRNKEGKMYAVPVPFNTSGDVLSLSKVDGFIELPAELNEFKSGSLFPVYLCSNE